MDRQTNIQINLSSVKNWLGGNDLIGKDKTFFIFGISGFSGEDFYNCLERASNDQVV